MTSVVTSDYSPCGTAEVEVNANNTSTEKVERIRILANSFITTNESIYLSDLKEVISSEEFSSYESKMDDRQKARIVDLVSVVLSYLRRTRQDTGYEELRKVCEVSWLRNRIIFFQRES